MSHSLTVNRIWSQPWWKVLRETEDSWREIVGHSAQWEVTVHRIEDGVAHRVVLCDDAHLPEETSLFQMDFIRGEASDSVVLQIGDGVLTAQGTFLAGFHATVDVAANASIRAHTLAASLAVALANLCQSQIDDFSSVWVEQEGIDPTAFLRQIRATPPDLTINGSLQLVGERMACYRRYTEAGSGGTKTRPTE